MAFWPFNRRKIEESGCDLTSAELEAHIRSSLTASQKSQLHDDPFDWYDGAYRAISWSDYEWLMFKCRQLEPDYVLSKFDCDNFAITFLGDMYRGWARRSGSCKLPAAQGWAWVKLASQKPGISHLMNWMWDGEAKELIWIEPQTDKRVPTSKIKYAYKMGAS